MPSNLPAIRDFYTRLCRRGKPRKVALVAAMRKLLLILNAAARTRALDTETAGRRTGGLEVVDSIMPETARRALKKTR